MSLFINGILRVIRPRSKVALDNLAIAFPEMDKSARKKLLNGMYANLSWMITEQLVLQRDPSMAEKWLDEIEGEEHAKEAVKQKRGMIFVSAHFGNWELFMAWGAQRGYPLYTIARGPNDPDLDELITRYREKSGLKALDRRGSGAKTIKLAKLLKSGNFLTMVGDVHESEGIELPFFGRNCKTPIGAAVLALLADVPIAPVFLYRKGPFSHKAVIGDPIRVPEGGTREERIEAITREINGCIENAVRSEPSLWFWMHKRWKK
ncbi:MAG: lysophospholipid acyltransferase family protein [Synergistaceae bacterium]|nr:lysophospholipid acyltransferase family protein [Synergistaceae bacterium]